MNPQTLIALPFSNGYTIPAAFCGHMHPANDTSRALPRHFHSLDGLRGLAALSVVFWHWQHFFYNGVGIGPFEQTRQPFYAFFKPLYLQGWRAVDLFFCLSGFIFFWLYSERIAKRETSARAFAVLRFSRLYPLHFVTLIFVAIAQWVMHGRFGSWFVYGNNDARHFVLQLLFLSGWGFERGESFNGPAWSISVEVLLYALFFLLCRLNFRKWWQAALLAVVGYWLIQLGLMGPGRGIFSFFIGGVAFHLFIRVWRANPSNAALVALAIVTVLLWFFIPWNASNDFLYHFYRDHLGAKLDIHGKDAIGYLLLVFSHNAFELVLFPLTLITLALWETRHNRFGKHLAPLGDLSYSSYLLHFPLQIVFALGVITFTGSRDFFYTPWALGLFFLVLIPVSLASHRHFEMLVQNYLRRRFQ